MINKSSKILCIVAHPDDEVLGLGGTLIKHSLNGDSVDIVFLSDGEGSKKDNINKNRLDNAKICSKIMGSKIYKIFDFPDQKLDTVAKIEIIKSIEDVLYKVQPDIIYTHHIGDINHDHQIVGHAVLTALRPLNNNIKNAEIRFFETPSSTEQSPNIDHYLFKPNFYVSITKEWKIKLKALEAYKNELGVFPHPRSIKSIEALAIKRGSESGLEKAEAIQIIRKFWL
tara:strand:- start:682 stop:1362 length:681 start_codon:yes stop_codon:yes gene_type:complete